jgi:hypothetical protein
VVRIDRDARLEIELVRLVAAAVVELPPPAGADRKRDRAYAEAVEIDDGDEVRVVLYERDPARDAREARPGAHVRRPVDRVVGAGSVAERRARDDERAERRVARRDSGRGHAE